MWQILSLIKILEHLFKVIKLQGLKVDPLFDHFQTVLYIRLSGSRVKGIPSLIDFSYFFLYIYIFDHRLALQSPVFKSQPLPDSGSADLGNNFAYCYNFSSVIFLIFLMCITNRKRSSLNPSQFLRLLKQALHITVYVKMSVFSSSIKLIPYLEFNVFLGRYFEVSAIQ